MVKSSGMRQSVSFRELNPKIKFIAVPLMVAISICAVVFIVITLANLPKPEGSQRGVGADGFRAFEEKDGDMGIGKITSKKAVIDALGAKAKEVNDVDTSTVFNLNGTRGQTATFDFIKANGKPASVYIDIMAFKNSAALDEANIYTNTMKTDPIKGHDAYFLHAFTIGSDREYRLMVVDGTKVYKYVLTQPFRDITISEVMALATLKKIAASSDI